MRGVTVAPGAHDDAPPLLDDLMPWSVAPLRFGRSWIVAPDARTLRARCGVCRTVLECAG